MHTPAPVARLSPRALNQWLESEKPVILIDTLTADHFARAHLPGAAHACVFEVTFLEQVGRITTDKQAEIVVYGASGHSQEADVAAEKLQREGFSRVSLLDGGLRAWSAAGYALAGESADSLPPPANRLVLQDGNYVVDRGRSVVEWAGRNPHTKHDGTVGVAQGEIAVDRHRISGVVDIDMRAIRNRSLDGDALQPVLLAHLQSDDFFFSQRFPTARFTIREARPRGDAYVGTPNVDVDGELNLRGVAADLAFVATASTTAEGELIARAQLELDRTRWGIIYGSARFFEHLGMHLVFDRIGIDLKIVASRR